MQEAAQYRQSPQPETTNPPIACAGNSIFCGLPAKALEWFIFVRYGVQNYVLN